MCQRLQHTLKILGVEQMVIGHTPQVNISVSWTVMVKFTKQCRSASPARPHWLCLQVQGANCECNGQVWRVDVGMSSGVLNAIPQV